MADTMVNLHEKFNAEHSTNNISYTTFNRYHLFWVRTATMQARDTRFCQKHENIQHSTERLYQ